MKTRALLCVTFIVLMLIIAVAQEKATDKSVKDATGIKSVGSEEAAKLYGLYISAYNAAQSSSFLQNELGKNECQCVKDLLAAKTNEANLRVSEYNLEIEKQARKLSVPDGWIPSPKTDDPIKPTKWVDVIFNPPGK